MCPACGQPLIALELEGVEIDYCAACGGVWLDAGELRTLISSFARGESGAVAAFLGDVLRCEFDAGPKGER